MINKNIMNKLADNIKVVTSSFVVDDSVIDTTQEEDVVPAPKKVFAVKFTINELIHLRDLFSVKLPDTLSVTLSQNLAAHEGRQFTEAQLWQKIAVACEEANIALEEESPDFTLGITSMPRLSVVEIASEPQYAQSAEEDVHCEDE